MFGMSEKEFWEDDPQLYWAYQTFYLRKKKDEIEQLNYNAWLSGIYTLSALNQSLSGIFGKKGQKSEIYPKVPINFKQEEEKKKEYTEQEINKIAVQDFNSWARFRKVGEKNG